VVGAEVVDERAHPGVSDGAEQRVGGVHPARGALTVQRGACWYTHARGSVSAGERVSERVSEKVSESVSERERVRVRESV
jgi:hypothetical protein